MDKVIALGVGGFIGSNLRYWISFYINNMHQTSFPWGTWVVNIIGCFVIGLLMGYGERLNPHIHLMLTTGLLGALTTFSTFSLETLSLIKNACYLQASVNVIANVLVGIAAVWGGYSFCS